MDPIIDGPDDPEGAGPKEVRYIFRCVVPANRDSESE